MKKLKPIRSKLFYIVFSFLFTFFVGLIGMTVEDIQHSFPLIESILSVQHYYTPIILGGIGAFVGFRYWENKSAVHLRLVQIEHTFRTYVEQSSDAYYLHDYEGNFYDFNRGGYESLGYSKNEFTRLNYYLIDISLNNSSNFKELLYEFDGNDSMVVERIYKCKDESLISVEVNVCNVNIDGKKLLLTTSRDISVRKQKEVELKEQNALLKASEKALKETNDKLFESKLHYQIIADYTYDWEYWMLPDGKFKYISPAVERITGYTPNEFEINPNLYTQIMLDDDIEIWQSHHNIISEASVDSESIEFRIKHKNGEIIWIEHLCIPVYDSHKKYIGVRGSNREITKRKLAENEIHRKNNEYKTLNIKYLAKNINLQAAIKDAKASEERFKHLFNLTFEGILIHKNGVAKSINNAFANMFGYSAEELIGNNIIDLIIDKSYHGIIHENMSKDHAEPFEVKGIKKGGDVLSIELESRFIRDINTNDKLRVAAVRDLSFRKKAESEIKKLSTAVEQSANLIIITDLNGKIEYANQKFYDTTGYNKTEVVGNSTRLLKSGVHNDRFYDEMWQIISRGKVWKGELCNKKKNGQLYWESAIITPVFNADNEIVNFIAMKEDITEKKATEIKLLNAIIETEERERKKFAEDLHDELGPHMSGIRLYASTLKKNSTNPDHILKTAELIDEMVKEAIEITRNISNMLMPNILMDFGIEMAIKSFCKRIADTNKIKFDLNLNELERPINQAVEIALYRIAIELIANTLKYAEASLISITLNQTKNEIELTYKDNGIGFNLKDVMKSKKGLGISNIINRLKTLEGHYSFESSAGKGILFNIIVTPSKLYSNANKI